MSRKDSNGLASTLAAIERARKAPREAIMPALLKSGEELARAQKALAESSRDTGALIDSITVTLPGGTTPPYSQPGGSRVAGETEVIVTAGNSDVRYAHLVEFGTSKIEAARQSAMVSKLGSIGLETDRPSNRLLQSRIMQRGAV